MSRGEPSTDEPGTDAEYTALGLLNVGLVLLVRWIITRFDEFINTSPVGRSSLEHCEHYESQN